MENNNNVNMKMSPADRVRIWKKQNVDKRTQQMQRRRYRQKVLQELMNILLDDVPN